MIPWTRYILLLLQPPASPLLATLLGLLLMQLGFRRLGRTLASLGLALLYLLSTVLVGNLLVRSLEDGQLPFSETAEGIDAVVVLTAGARDLSHLGLGPEPGASSLTRLAEGIAIHRRLQGIPLIISGGRADPARPELSIGRALSRTAVALGVPAGRLVVEDESRNTLEGAHLLGARLREIRRIVLVTSGFHMQRSRALYRSAGFDVVPAPTDFMGEPVRIGLDTVVPSAGGVGLSSVAVYEYLSRLWYVVKELVTGSAV